MTFRFRGILPTMMLAAALALAACDSSEERAERYYKSGMELLAAGDEERALVEFRNVFKYNGFHKEARQAYADIQLKRGEVDEAYSQYLRLIEQYPDTAPVRQTLAEIAISRGDWDEAERHGRAALALTPDAPGVIAINAALDYREARLADDSARLQTAVAAASSILQKDPGNLVARRVVVDAKVTGSNPQSAMADIDATLAQAPELEEFQILKLQLLIEAKDTSAIGKQLQEMARRFPDNDRVRSGLVSWYLEQGDNSGAEAFLRSLADKAGDDPAPRLTVVRLLQQTKGAAAAQAELSSLIAANADKPTADIYRALAALIDFESGKRSEALTAMEAILTQAVASEQTRSIKVMLAQMQQSAGSEDSARARINEVLTEDPGNVEALKMRAQWLIESDKPGDAILALRTALDQNPRDSSVLMLMADAHERDGSPELAGERLALAVEVSGNAPIESMRYAAFLLTGSNDVATAQKVLLDCLRANPANVPVMRALAEVLVQTKDWSRSQQLLTVLRSVPGPEAAGAANAVAAAILIGQNRNDESIAFLQNLIDDGNGDLSSVAIIIQTKVRSGKTAEARSYLDDVLSRAPTEVSLRFLSANLYALMGQTDQAESLYRALIAEDSEAEPAMRALYTLLRDQKRPEEATAVLDASIATRPKSAVLRWMKAGELEARGDIDGAVQIYEQLYAEDSNNLVIANNLASLLIADNTDPENLERAFTVARRLRGNSSPAFQDTYGWLEYRRGNFEEALRSLKPAALGLPDDPMVQLHLGMAYAALRQTSDATETLNRALKMAGESTAPAYVIARETLASLSAPTPVTP